MIRAVIIDDEANSRESIREVLRLYCEDVVVVGEAESVVTGQMVITELKPDLIFLDIRMPDGTGFDLLQRLGKIDFRVIFVTAYEEYAIKAFKFNAIDYITKPIDADDLKLAVQKAGEYFNKGTVNETIKMLLDAVGKPPAHLHKRVVLRTVNTVHVLEIEKIIRCESDRNYTAFHLVDEEKSLSQGQ